jgi:hypothetical protein
MHGGKARSCGHDSEARSGRNQIKSVMSNDAHFLE